MEVKHLVENNTRYSRFPWRGDNQFHLLINAEQFIPAMLHAIDDAKWYVLFEMYLIETSDITSRFIDSILAAAHRGVIFYIILDDFGSLALNQRDRHRLAHRNINLCFFNPLRWSRIKHYLFRDHRKLLLVDGNKAFTGSAGITRENDPSCPARDSWRDTMLEITGPVVNDWKSLFESVWNRSTPTHLRLPLSECNDNRNHMFGRVISSRPMRSNSITGSVIRHGLKARERIWFATAYFQPPGKLRRMLRKKARQNVDVRLLLPGEKADHPSVWYFGQRHYRKLLRAGVRIFEYQPHFMHTKAVLCDYWCSIGSSNFDRWEFPRNLEANQEIVNPEFAEQLKIMFEMDFSNSREIFYDSWTKRSWMRRIREWIWSQVGRFFLARK